MAGNVARTKVASSVMMIGKIVKHIGEKNQKTVQVRCKKLKMDTFLTMYFSEAETVLADDPNEKCQVGDHVLIKQFIKPIRAGVDYGVKEVVFKFGEHVDPLTGYECAGPKYREGQLPDPHETLAKYGVKYVSDGTKQWEKIS